jgi:hypothetical protein
MSNDNIIKLGGDDGFAKLFEIRNWLSDAVATQGADVVGAGMGMGQYAGAADFDFYLVERHYWVNIEEVEEVAEVEPPKKAKQRPPQDDCDQREIMGLVRCLIDAAREHGADVADGQLFTHGDGDAEFVFSLSGQHYLVQIEDVGDAAVLAAVEGSA